jgi:hypothetical protein
MNMMKSLCLMIFIDMINKKQKDKLCIQNGDNFKYCRDIDGYRFSDTDFS